MVGRGGFGLITSSNFFVPQVNQASSMASFMSPAAIPVWLPGTKGGGPQNGWTVGLNSARRVAPLMPYLSAAGLGQTAQNCQPLDFLCGLDFTPAILAAYAPWLIGGAVVLFLLAS